MADTLTDLPAKLEQLLAGHGVRQAIITGFSSGGYASLYVATQMELLGYVGYSIYTDVSTASALPQRQMFRALQGQVPEELLLDMRQTVDTPSQRLTLYYGQRDPIDRAHAQHLEGCRGVKIVAHPDANHEVPAHLMEEGRFAAPFLALLGAAAP